MKRWILCLIALFAVVLGVGLAYSVGPPVTITTFPVDSYLVKAIGDSEFEWQWQCNVDILAKHNGSSRAIVLDEDVWCDYMEGGYYYTDKLVDCPGDTSNVVASGVWTELTTSGYRRQDEWEGTDVELWECWAGPDYEPGLGVGPILITDPPTNCAGIADWDYPSFPLFTIDYLNATEQYPSADDFNVTAKWSYLACLTYENETIDHTVAPKINVQFRDPVVDVWGGDVTIKDLAYQVPAYWNMYQAFGETYINTSLNPPIWYQGTWIDEENHIIGWTTWARLTFKVYGNDDEWHDYVLPGSGIKVYHHN